MHTKSKNTVVRFSMLVLLLAANIEFAMAAEQNATGKMEFPTAAAPRQSMATSDKTLLAWLPGKNRNSHPGACTEEDINEGGCETKKNETTGIEYWCSCPKEVGEN